MAPVQVEHDKYMSEKFSATRTQVLELRQKNIMHLINP